MRSAPYDKKNQEDYAKITQNILAGLEALAKDRREPATEKNLARLSKCSRSTLRNRGWSLERLKEIKSLRQKQDEGGQEDTPSATPTAEEIHLDDKKKLLEQLNKSRDECGRLFNSLEEKESKCKRLERVVETLKASNDAKDRRVSELERELISLKGHDGQPAAVIIPFAAIKTDAATTSEGSGQEVGS